METDQSFLGEGWSFPPQFSYNGALLTTVAGNEDIQQSLKILFTTNINERLMHPDYGCAMKAQLFEAISHELVNTLKNMLEDAVLNHEPRIVSEGITIETDDEQGDKLLISISYRITETNSRYNMVFPFYLNEANENF